MQHSVRTFIFLLLFCLGANEGKAQTAEKDLDRASEAYNKGDYKTAITLYNKVIASKQSVYSALVGRAQTYYAINDQDKAFRDFIKAIELEPDNVHGYIMRGFTVLNEHFDISYADFSYVIEEMDPSNSIAYLGRAFCYRYMREPVKALSDIDKAIMLDPDRINYYGTRAMIYTELGRYESAVSDTRKLRELDTQNDFFYFLVNAIEPLARLRQFDEALNIYSYLFQGEQASVNDDSYMYYVVDLKPVLIYLAKGDYLMADNVLAELQKSYSSDTSQDMKFQNKSYSFLLSLKGYALEKMDKRKEATEAYKLALVFNDIQPDVIEGLARLETKNKAIVVQNDTEDPQIQILEPARSRSISIEDDNPASTHQRIRGQVKDAGGVKSVKVNNVAVKVEDNGYFETVVNLVPGRNTFTVVATDNAANVTSVNVEVEASKGAAAAAPPPVVGATEFNATPVYHAILIAESEYSDKNITSLPGPLTDMEKISDLLVNNYTFDPARVTKLVNATRTNILETIAKISASLTEKDNLFIFYAGHGQMVKRPDGKEDGFLVPSDATKGALSTYIRGDALFQTMEYSKAKHILVVADACFAGSLFRDMGTEAEVSVLEAYKDQSRKVLASGNRTIVPDESKFIAYLRTSLLNNKKKYVTAEQIVNGFKDAYINETRLNLQYYPIAGVDLGGQFVFIRK